MSEPWFNELWFGVLYGAGVGGGGGTLLGLVGALAGVLVPRNKGRAFVVGGMAAFAVFGLASLVVGLVALSSGQPYGIWYPLVLVGGIFGFVGGGLTVALRQAYQAAERRHMLAQDLRQDAATS